MDRPPPIKRNHSSSSSDSDNLTFLTQSASRSNPFIPSLKSIVPEMASIYDGKILKRKKFSDSMTFNSIFPGQHSSLAAAVKSFLKALESEDILPSLSDLATEISIAQEPVLLSIPMGKVLEGLKICLEHPTSEVVLMAMNCFITLIEVAPNCSIAIISLGALPILLEKVGNPDYIDVAEKSIKIMEKISKSEGLEILNQDIFSVAIEKIDFYETEVQKSIISIGINILNFITQTNQSKVMNNKGFLSVFQYLQSPVSLKALEFIELYLEKIDSPQALVYQILDSQFFVSLSEIFYGSNSKTKVLSVFKSLIKNAPKFTLEIFNPKFLEYIQETVEKGNSNEITEVLQVLLGLLEASPNDELFGIYKEIACFSFANASLLFYKLVEINEHVLIVKVLEKLVKLIPKDLLENFVADSKLGSFLAEAMGKSDFLTVNYSVYIVNELLDRVPETVASMMINEGVFSRLKGFKLIGEVNKLERPIVKKMFTHDPYGFSMFSTARSEKILENSKLHNENVRKLVKTVKDILANCKKYEKIAAQKSATLHQILKKIVEGSETDFFKLLDLLQAEKTENSLSISRYEFTSADCGSIIWTFLSESSNFEVIFNSISESPNKKVSYLETLFKITLESFQFLQSLINQSGKGKKTNLSVQLEYFRKQETQFQHPVFTEFPTFALNLNPHYTVENLKSSLLGVNSEQELNFLIESCKFSSRIGFVEGIQEFLEDGSHRLTNKRTDLEVKLYLNESLLEPWMTVQDLASITCVQKVTVKFEIIPKPKLCKSSLYVSNSSETVKFILNTCQENGINHFHKLFPYASILKMCYLSSEWFFPHLGYTPLPSKYFLCEKLSAQLQSPNPDRFFRSFAVNSGFLFTYKSRVKYFYSFSYMNRRHHAYKYTVDRKNVMKSAQNVLNEAGNDHIEIDFLGEPGIGQGPTLEFFNLVSKEIEKMPIWVNSNLGLFPHPECEDFSGFYFVGKFVGKVILDKRIADLPLSPIFLKQVLGSVVLKEDLKELDSSLYNSLCVLGNMPAGEIEKLQLPFTLPGFNRQLCPQMSNSLVTTENYPHFYSQIIKTYLLTPSAASAFREGVEKFISVKDLIILEPTEIKTLLCGENPTPWSAEILAQALVPTHGFTVNSKTYQNLLTTLQEFNLSQQEKFIKFVTGSPRLPNGGLLGLSPKLTVVRKEDSGDTHLPSVMTCANYLKIPDYTSIEILKKNLTYAMEECGNTFYLS